MKGSKLILLCLAGGLLAFIAFFVLAVLILPPLRAVSPFSVQAAAFLLMVCALLFSWLAARISRGEGWPAIAVGLGVGAVLALLVLQFGNRSSQAGDPLSTGWQAALLILAAAAVGGVWHARRRWVVYLLPALLVFTAVFFIWRGPDAFLSRNVEIPGQGVTLGATLTIPTDAGDSRRPAVLLVPGSGQQTRNVTVGRSHLFQELAEYLSSHGFVVLRYDKRGVAGSSGAFTTAGLLDFAADAESAFDYLRRLPEVDPNHVFLIGHSYGGKAATIVASRQPDVAGLILLASVASPEPDNMRRQQQEIMNLSGASATEAEQWLADFEAWMEGVSNGRYQTYEDYFGPNGLSQALQAAQEVNPIPPIWLRQAMAYDQLAALAALERPILVLSGSSDWVVPSSEIVLIEETLQKAGNAAYTVALLPGLDHRFAAMTSPAESFQMALEPEQYYDAPDTYPMAPEALEMIVGWLQRQSR